MVRFSTLIDFSVFGLVSLDLWWLNLRNENKIRRGRREGV